MTPQQAQGVIRAHKNAGKSERDRWDKFHDWYMAKSSSGRQLHPDDLEVGDDSSLSLETNYPYAWIDTMIAAICPSNPQISISARNPEMKEQAKMRELLANDTMRWNKLHTKGWRVAGHAAMAGFGVTKTVWNFRKKRPVTMVVDPRKVIWDRGVDDWEDITYVAEATVIREDEFKARARKRKLPGGGSAPAKYSPKASEQAKFSAWPAWLKRADEEDRSSHLTEARDVFRYVVVWEFYDFVNGNYWHLLEGVEEPLFQGGLPYDWMRNPYDLVVFNDNLIDTTGISDIHLIANLQDRLNEIDTLELWHALTTMPISVLNEAGLENPEAAKSAIQNATGPGALATINLKQGYRLQDVFTTLPSPTLSPSFDKMRGRVESIMEFTLSLPQFARGGLGNSDVATELALANEGVQTRNGRRVRVMEDWQASVGRKYIALWAENMDPTEPIPVREPGKKHAELYDYGEFGFDDENTFMRDWYFEYEAAPYSPTENHALIQLQKLQQFAPMLFGSEFVDNEKLTAKLLELLKMSELKGEGPDSAPVPVAGQPGVPGAPGMQANEASLAQGALPPEMAAQAQALIGGAMPAVPGISEPPVGG